MPILIHMLIQEGKQIMKKILLYLVMSTATLLVGVVPSFAGGPPPPLPEPATIVLMGVGVAGLVAYRVIKRRKK